MTATRSVCPVCLRPLDATLIERDGATYLIKTCPAHGRFTVPVWRGRLDRARWCAGKSEGEVEGEGEGKADTAAAASGACACAPGAAGCDVARCAAHQSGTCCALLEVTHRCNLRCTYCFADGGSGPADPTLAELQDDARGILRASWSGAPLIQLSGGEPTLRNDLPAFVAFLKEAGFPYVQLNTNGLRLSKDPAYARALYEAGLSFVFLQFDGLTDAVYETLRGRPLLREKRAAIDVCGECGLGVTLVPTVVRGVNDRALGELARFGASLSPAVRGVHYQPVTYLGRYPALADERYTLDELVADLCAQLDMDARRLLPSRCDHPLCGFHGSFLVQADGALLPLSDAAAQAAAACRTTAAQNRAYVARHWLRAAEPPCCRPQSTSPAPQAGAAATVKAPHGPAPVQASRLPKAAVRRAAPPRPVVQNAAPMEMDAFLARAKTHAFTLSGMAFQDAVNLDAARLRRCSLHVWHEGRLLPFCARYLTPVAKP